MSGPEHETIGITRCGKCGRVSGFRPGSKYCGDGGDKDNSHRWRKVEVTSDELQQAWQKHVEKWGEHASLESWSELRSYIDGAEDGTACRCGVPGPGNEFICMVEASGRKEGMCECKCHSHETQHVLYKTEDKDKPDTITDINGEVVLGLCRVCGRGERELSEPCTKRELKIAELPDALQDSLGDKTPWEFACGWYIVDEIHRSIQNRHLSGFVRTEIPSDIESREFAEWLTDQYRLAMRKGIEIGLRASRVRQS